MKKLIIFIASGLLILLFGTSVNAQITGAGSNKPVFRVSDNKDGDSSRGANINQKLEGIKQKIDEKRKELIAKFFNLMLKRFEAAIARLDRLIERIDSRLEKIKATGQDVTALEAQLGAAKDKLNQAKSDLKSLKTGGINFTSSADPKTAFAEVKQKVGLLRDEIKGVHQALVQIITKIKGLRVGTNKEASPSGDIKPTLTPAASPSASL